MAGIDQHPRATFPQAPGLLRIRDLDGRPLGYGVPADLQGTVLTAHEVVAGRPGVLLESATGECREAGPAALTELPGCGLALVDGGGTGGVPWALGPYEGAGAVLLTRPDDQPAQLDAAVLGLGTALGSGPGAARLLEAVLLVDLPSARPEQAGLPVLDARSGAVLGLLAPGLRGVPPGVLAALPVWPVDRTTADGPLAELLERNALAAPGYGPALNIAGVLELCSRQLAAASAGPGRIVQLAADRVERPDGLAGEEPQLPLTVLAGEPGSGRSSELAALAVRRSGGSRPLPTLWLRGADLRAGDRTPEQAVDRALGATHRVRALARVAAAAGRPLLVVLDGPEEAATALDGAWLRETVQWLREAGVRLLLACRPESWEQYAPGVEPGAVQLHRLGPLRDGTAASVAERYAVPCPAGEADPLALRLAGELIAAGVRQPTASRSELYAGALDLCCLRIAQRIADGPGDPAHPRRPSAHRRGAPLPCARSSAGQVRRLAAAVAGRVHEAARRMLGPGQGGLGPTAFAELFPPGAGWAQAVLAEGLFVVAGGGYRLAHEELADWLQGLHLDLDAALRLLLAEDGQSQAARAVPRHRAGAVALALRTLAESRGAAALDGPSERIWRALDDATGGARGEGGDEEDGALWWASRLLAAVLRAGPDPAVHRELLERLAERIAERAAPLGGFARLREGQPGGLGRFGPAFWAGLPLELPDRLDLLRRLVRADGPEQGFLALAAEQLRADPRAALPLFCRWFADGRGLPGRSGASVADLTQELLYAHRALAIDELTEELVAAAHPRADALLSVLAVEEPSALCRAVDRWSHDPRPERHVAAAVHAVRAAPYASGVGGLLLRHAATALLAREDEPGLHGAALALLVRDPRTRARHLPAALAAYRADDSFVTAEALGPALATDRAEVLAAFEARLAAPGSGVAQVLRVLAEAGAPDGRGGGPAGLPDPGTRLAGRLLRERPERAGLVAEYLAHRLARGTAVQGDLTALLGPRPADRPAAVRRAFALVLVAPAAGEPLREEFLDRLLATEPDPAVLEPVLERLALAGSAHRPERARAVVRRIADAWERAAASGADGPSGADRLDAALVRCAGRTAGFARLLAEWPAEALPPAGGPLLARMRELAAQGRDPQYAAAEAERDPVRRTVASPSLTAGVPVPERGPAHGTL
ncbi:hypothetical protein [Kitasatospora mediocidica]|uniref:hypothetical protein n=1 Tax=Kitasatospora mediocidica TaxID=58352 RepID=UPI00068A7B03|nr:hypothetical protein [Kitasatospora mediocidica]